MIPSFETYSKKFYMPSIEVFLWNLFKQSVYDLTHTEWSLDSSYHHHHHHHHLVPLPSPECLNSLHSIINKWFFNYTWNSIVKGNFILLKAAVPFSESFYFFPEIIFLHFLIFHLNCDLRPCRTNCIPLPYNSPSHVCGKLLLLPWVFCFSKLTIFCLFHSLS